jgi:hypothetical protein
MTELSLLAEAAYSYIALDAINECSDFHCSLFEQLSISTNVLCFRDNLVSLES